MSGKIRIGALISGGGTNLQAIIDACELGRIDGDMVFVGSDNPQAKGLARAEKHQIPSFVVDDGLAISQYDSNPDRIQPPSDLDLEDIMARQKLLPDNASLSRVRRFVITRAVCERKLLDHMAGYPFDLLVLAGFMRNLTPYFIDRVNLTPSLPRIMNIHPALLPAFPGVDGYGDTFRHGCRIGGCTVHFIDYGEDSGPIIGQRCFPIAPSDTLDQVKRKGLEKEWELYPECIQLFATGRLRVTPAIHELTSRRIYRRNIVTIDPH